MHKVCYENDIDGLQAQLRSVPDNTDAFGLRDQHGWTALHVAVFMNRVEVTKLLIASGANIFEVTGNSNLTALHIACSRGLSKIVVVLLGLDIEVPRKRRRAYCSVYT
jgi:ankyrin repeat protein